MENVRRPGFDVFHLLLRPVGGLGMILSTLSVGTLCNQMFVRSQSQWWWWYLDHTLSFNREQCSLLIIKIHSLLLLSLFIIKKRRIAP